MKKTNRLRAATPAVFDDQQPFSDLEWRMITYLVASGGKLHPYLPKQPHWCRTIGDDVWATLQRGEPVSQRDFVRLAAAFLAAQLNRPDWELGSELRSFCRQAVDEFFATVGTA